MIRSRWGAAAALALCVVLAGCGKQSKSLTGPAKGSFTPGRLGVMIGSVPTSISPTSASLRFGAGVPFTGQASGFGFIPANKLSFRWDYDPNLIELQDIFPDPALHKLLILRGTSQASVESTTVAFNVVWLNGASHTYTVTAVDSLVVSVVTRCPEGLPVGDPDSLCHRDSTFAVAHDSTFTVTADSICGQALATIRFIRAAQRDIVGDIRVYHITRSVGGVIGTEVDTVLARFINQDQAQTPMSAGNPFSVAGAPMTDTHTPDGVFYHGPILFKIPGEFDIATPGPQKDPKAQIPKLQLKVNGPDNELIVTSPDGRNLVPHDKPISVQWSGGTGDTLLDLTLLDSQGHQIQVQTRDNGRFDLTPPQVQLLSPGVVEISLSRVVRRTFSSSFLGSRGPLFLTSDVKIIEESHASFFLR